MHTDPNMKPIAGPRMRTPIVMAEKKNYVSIQKQSGSVMITIVMGSRDPTP